MTTFIKKLSFFILFTIFSYVLVIIIGGRISPRFVNVHYKRGGIGYLNSRLKEVKNTKDVDILFLGNSHTYRAFDPRIFSKHNFKTFNLGSSAQTPIQTQILLKRYLNELNPKLIIWEVSPLILTSDGVESTIDLISNDKINMDDIKLSFRVNNMKVYNTLIFALSKLSQIDSYVEPIRKDNNTYISGGFVERDLIFNKPPKSIKENEIGNPKPFKDIQQSAFEDIVNLLRISNIPYILVQTPTTKDYQSDFFNEKGKFDSLMNKYGEYYNFNSLDLFDDSLHFYDNHHLNQNGVILYDSIIINNLNLRGRIKQ